MTEQLVFELAVPEPPSFGNFLHGANAEAVGSLEALAAATISETVFLLWGAPGAGKTHLLRAAVAAVRARGLSATLVPDLASLQGEEVSALAAESLVAVDGVDIEVPPETQAHLFTLFNGLRENGHRLVVASRAPLAALHFRDDLRTRLGWGLIYELTPLADGDKAAALAAYARQRGVRLADDVIAYLLTHGRRDMASLTGALVALDRHSLAYKRPITIPLLKAWLQQQIPLVPR